MHRSRPGSGGVGGCCRISSCKGPEAEGSLGYLKITSGKAPCSAGLWQWPREVVDKALEEELVTRGQKWGQGLKAGEGLPLSFSLKEQVEGVRGRGQ